MFGIEVKRAVPKNKNNYFNTGELSPLEENTCNLYDKFYSDEEALKEYYTSFRKKFYDEVIKFAEQNKINYKNKKLLDVGCGVGYLLERIQKIEENVILTGADFSQSAVDASSAKFPNIEFIQHDICDPLKQKYDIIYCTEVLEHILDPFKALNNLWRALNIGGSLVLTVPNGRNDNLNEHLNFWSPESWPIFLNYCVKSKTICTQTIIESRYNIAIIQKCRD